MPAHVVEAVQLSVLGVGQQDRLVENRRGLEITGTSQLVAMRDELPGSGEDAVFLALQDRRVEVDRRRKGRRSGDIGLQLRHARTLSLGSGIPRDRQRQGMAAT